MPPRPPDARRSSKGHRSVTEPRPSDHVTAKASGLYQTTSVQDRIQQWQAHGAAIAPAPDEVSVFSTPRSELSITPEPPQRSRAQREDNLQARNTSESRKFQKTDLAQDHGRRMRSSSTPRKRIVSDEHWKAKRSPKRSPGQERSSRQQEENEVRIMAQDTEPTKRPTEKSIKQAKTEREERRRRRIEARSAKLQPSKDPERDGRRAHTLPVSLSRSEHGESLASQHDNIDPDEFMRHKTSPATGELSDLDFKDDTKWAEDNDRPRERSKYAEMLSMPPPTHHDAQLRSKKGSFLHKTKEVLGLKDDSPVLPSRLPSIEAWLYDQPDPFVDEVPQRVRFNDDVDIAPKQNSTRKKKSRVVEPLRDPNEIWNAIGGSELERPEVGTTNDRTHSSKPNDSGEASSPASLKRRGAKALRIKRHTVSYMPQEAEHLRAESNNKDNSIVHNIREERACPQTGPTKLSTIASVETFHEKSQIVVDPVEHSSISGKITSDEDMMTVLSRPSLRKSTRRKHSSEATGQEQGKDTVKQTLDLLADDETKYSRELRTLVDGVVPVLLQCVLSKTDAIAAAEFFTSSSSTNNDLSISRPIIDMGVALERLKNLHSRIPLSNVDSLLAWCQTAHRAYSEYLKVWRLAFQDVVVNLAPLEGSDNETNEVMDRNADGDIVNAEGDTVDIAYLMKRPLVNIRKLARALSALHEALPNHPILGKIAEDYCELTAAAKAKHQQEKARLEDEAAANIDATKCRDIRNMAPLPGVVIDKTKRVRARDCFDMTLFHSTGQRMDCKVEMILRDSQQNAAGGDVLICQIEAAGKWLLFAPVDLACISARKGESSCDLVLMIRGRLGMASEWHELLALTADEPEAASEWMVMLGSNPLPPKINQVSGFVSPITVESKTEIKEAETVTFGLTKAALRRMPSAETFDVPVGEPSVLGITVSNEVDKGPNSKALTTEKPLSQLSLGGGLSKQDVPEHWQYPSSMGRATQQKIAHQKAHPSKKPPITKSSTKPVQTSGPSCTEVTEPIVEHQKLTEKRQSRIQQQGYGPQIIPSVDKPSSSGEHTPPIADPVTADVSTRRLTISSKAQDPDQERKRETLTKAQDLNQEDKREVAIKAPKTPPKRPVSTRAHSSAPSESLPSIPKTRESKSTSMPLTDTIRETWSAMSGFGRKAPSQPNVPTPKDWIGVDILPDETPSRQHQKVLDRGSSTNTDANDDTPPPPPQHKQIPILGPRSNNVPTLGPSEAQIRMDKQNGRISYSPLRKEYTPSSASNSETSDSEFSDDDSQTSEDSQDDYASSPLPKPPPHRDQLSQIPIGAPASNQTAGTRTLAPSDSASQGPYRRVASSADRPDVAKKRAVAMICSWNDKGIWEPLVEEYCSIIISPGLLEAFLMNEGHSAASTPNQSPLAAFELTPIVPLRRPTGLDINIRSPPTPDSQIKTSSNIMFRSHNPVECEALYQMIHWARCHNPTYLELQRSRPQSQPPVSFSTQQAPRPRSWFSFGSGMKRQNSYRVGNVPPSSMGESQATANSVGSAMSALRRLTKSSAFNVNRSSVIRRPGLKTSESLYSSSNGTGIESGKSTPPPSQLGTMPGKDGPTVPPTSNAALYGGGMVHNMKIRLQIRQSQGWVTMGLSRLTVLPAVKHSDGSPDASRPGSSGSSPGGNEAPSRRASTIGGSGNPQTRQYRLSSSNFTPHRLHGGGREKRVVVTADKNPSRVLLDATLGESSFEKISQLGIAVQVWRADEEIRSRGGVGLGQNTTYLFQFFHAKECAWVFDLVGKYRYSNVMTS